MIHKGSRTSTAQRVFVAEVIAPPTAAKRRARARARRRGLTLLEVVIALAGFAVAAGAAFSAMISAMSAELQHRETLRAMEGAQSVIEALRAADFETVFAEYNANPADDPNASCPGSDFRVLGLSPRAGDGDAAVGEILFPGDGTVLREDVDDVALGLPRDIDLDGDIDATDLATTYRLLPVRVRVQWSGALGNRELELVTVLTEQ